MSKMQNMSSSAPDGRNDSRQRVRREAIVLDKRMAQRARREVKARRVMKAQGRRSEVGRMIDAALSAVGWYKRHDFGADKPTKRVMRSSGARPATFMMREDRRPINKRKAAQVTKMKRDAIAQMKRDAPGRTVFRFFSNN